MMTAKATEESWSWLPMPDQRRPVTLDRHYGHDEFERLALGLVPHEQEDHWFIWVGDDLVVHFHRSWTGMAVYEVQLIPSGDGYDVSEAWINDDPEQYRPEGLVDFNVLGPMLDRLAGR
jgi:hypothetical protein